MKKKRLVVDFNYDFDLWGIIAPIKEYKLAWHINNNLNLTLTKQKDISIELAGKEPLIISNLIHSTENSVIKLLCNRSQNVGQAKYLLKELKEFDYLLYIADLGDAFEQEKIAANLRKLKDIQYITKIDVEKLKEKENLIF